MVTGGSLADNKLQRDSWQLIQVTGDKIVRSTFQILNTLKNSYMFIVQTLVTFIQMISLVVLSFFFYCTL